MESVASAQYRKEFACIYESGLHISLLLLHSFLLLERGVASGETTDVRCSSLATSLQLAELLLTELFDSILMHQETQATVTMHHIGAGLLLVRTVSAEFANAHVHAVFSTYVNHIISSRTVINSFHLKAS